MPSVRLSERVGDPGEGTLYADSVSPSMSEENLLYIEKGLVVELEE